MELVTDGLSMRRRRLMPSRAAGVVAPHASVLALLAARVLYTGHGHSRRNMTATMSMMARISAAATTGSLHLHYMIAFLSRLCCFVVLGFRAAQESRRSAEDLPTFGLTTSFTDELGKGARKVMLEQRCGESLPSNMAVYTICMLWHGKCRLLEIITIHIMGTSTTCCECSDVGPR